MPRTNPTNYIAPAPYTPDIAIPPGATIKEAMESLGMSRDYFVERIRLPAAWLDQVIEGKRAISPQLAERMEPILLYPADFWLNLERNYRLTLARLQ